MTEASTSAFCMAVNWRFISGRSGIAGINLNRRDDYSDTFFLAFISLATYPIVNPTRSRIKIRSMRGI